MNPNLIQALKYLGITDESTAKNFLDYLDFSGYLDNKLLLKAVRYIHTERPLVGFETADIETIVAQLQNLFYGSTTEIFSPFDLADLIVFLQQTAFDRQFATERNELTSKPWMNDAKQRNQFLRLQEACALTNEQLPKQMYYHAVGIMGASYPRAIKRIEYFNTINASLHFEHIFAMTGKRALSDGLDGKENIQLLAETLGTTPQYILNEYGKTVVENIDETDMVESLIKTYCPEHRTKISVIDSQVSSWHWRADTSQNAKDFASILIQAIQNSETRPLDGIYQILIIVEQPYANRMSKQIQRALDDIAQRYNHKNSDDIHFIVEASGKGIPTFTDEATAIKAVTQSNSDFAAWLAECYKDFRLSLALENITQRNADCIMFSSREKYFALNYLRHFVTTKYPHLNGLITSAQYEQLDWVDDTNRTNEASLAPQVDRAVSFQQQRLLARLHFLYVLKNRDYETFTKNQSNSGLTPLEEHNFNQLSYLINSFSESEYQALWVASVTSISPKAIALAKAKFGDIVPSDSVEFLAFVMTQRPSLYPAAQELIAQDNSATFNFSIMFDTGHFRHMMYVEGDNKMFDKLREKITYGNIGQQQLDQWFAYWLIDITAFRLHTKDGLGSEYLRNDTFRAINCIKGHLDQLCLDVNKPILENYLTDRATWIRPETTLSRASLLGTPAIISQSILARIASLLRVFTVTDGQQIQNGLIALQRQLGDSAYYALLENFNPLTSRPEPTPTYGPALLANLYAKTGTYEKAILLGLPLICRALENYRRLFQSGETRSPLSLNGLASPENIDKIIAGEKLNVTINSENGQTNLMVIACEDQPIVVKKI
jgi:hypothetical protein